MFQLTKKPTAQTQDHPQQRKSGKMSSLMFAVMTTCGVLNLSMAWAETQSFNLTGSEGVSAAEGIDVQITTGAAFEVIAESEDDRQLEYLSLNVTRGVLTAEMDDGLFAPDWVTGDKVEIRIVMPTLIRTEALSGARIVAETMSGSDLDASASSGSSLVIAAVEGGTMQVEVASGANIKIAGGSCASLSAEVSGGSSLGMENVICGEADIDASSGSTASVHADNAVDANASGGASIRVYGAHAETETSNSGGGTVVME